MYYREREGKQFSNMMIKNEEIEEREKRVHTFNAESDVMCVPVFFGVIQKKNHFACEDWFS